MLGIFVVLEVVFYVYMTCRLNEWYQRDKEGNIMSVWHLLIAFSSACVLYNLGWI